MPHAGPRHPLDIPQALALVAHARARSAILVEGWSDEAALAALAAMDGTDLADHGVIILPVGGVTNFERFARALRPARPGPEPMAGVRLCGLYDAAEEPLALRGLQRAGVDVALTRAAAAHAGFFVCDTDLEDELIRAHGTAGVERLLAAQDELSTFRRFQCQPAQVGRDTHAQLRRFMGTRSGRKIRYGALLVAALEPAHVPLALRRVLSRALA